MRRIEHRMLGDTAYRLHGSPGSSGISASLISHVHRHKVSSAVDIAESAAASATESL